MIKMAEITYKELAIICVIMEVMYTILIIFYHDIQEVYAVSRIGFFVFFALSVICILFWRKNQNDNN